MKNQTLILMCILAALLCTNTQAKIIYVDDDANGANDGSSWENAYIFLQDALTDARNSEKPLEIRVAQGIYKPDEGVGQTKGNRDASFKLLMKVTISGSYAGIGQPDPNERNIELYETVLSGDLNCDDVEITNLRFLFYDPSRSDNSFNVIKTSFVGNSSRLDGFTITGGNANGDSPGYGLTDNRKEGGGIYNFYSNPEITNCKFIRNSAYKGGGFYNYNGPDAIFDSPYLNNPSLTNCTFIENMSEEYGGGIYNYSGYPILTNCIFRGNTAAENGGGMYNYFTTDTSMYKIPGILTLNNCTFIWNSADSDGGGMYNYSSIPTLTNCIFNINLALNNGGGIFNSNSNSTFSNCTFNQNIAESSGGGIYILKSSPILSNCTFSENIAEYDGGGILNTDNSNPKIMNCIFNWNSANVFGGGLKNSYNSNPLIEKCLFNNNYAEANGGGIYNDSANAILIHCIFSRNSFSYPNFKLVSIDKSNLIVNNCTFVENSTLYGNAIGCSSLVKGQNNIELTNCIIRDDMNNVWNNDDSIITISYCDVKGGQANVYDPNGEIIWGEGNIDNDPCFVSQGLWDANGTPDNMNDDFWVEGDYHLKSQAGRFDPNSQSWVLDDVTSPCIDAGDPNSPIGYEPFPNGGRINIGAYGGTIESSMSLNDVNYFQQASYPNPEYGSVNVFLDTMLSWVSDPNAAIYEVYFGTNEQPPFIQKQYETVFDPSPLEPNTTYYWRIDEIDSSLNRVTGNTWMFLTGNQSIHPSHPYPVNGETIDVNIKTRLSWFSGLNALTYDVYFGTDFNNVNEASIMNPLGVLVSAGQEPNFYTIPDTLKHDKTYFWRVDEKDNNGIITKGNIWSFVTVPKVPGTRG
jgi:parallel beta-helix repeat protein/predicted outer membrane repeat protein